MSRRFLVISCGLIYFFLMLPLLVVFPISLSSAPYMQFPPPGLSWQWYERYLDDPQWIDATWRSLYIGEQELFSSSKIRRSQELLQRLGYFDEVTITPEPTAKPDAVDLNVAVREGNTGTFSAGAGISSGEGFIVSTRISENNLFGTGNSLTLDLNSGSERENYVLSFANPRVYDTRWSLGIDGLITSREYDDFDKDQSGGSISAGYPLWFLGPEYLDDVRFNVQYELLAIDIHNVDDDAAPLVLDSEGKSTSSSVTPVLRYCTLP